MLELVKFVNRHLKCSLSDCVLNAISTSRKAYLNMQTSNLDTLYILILFLHFIIW